MKIQTEIIPMDDVVSYFVRGYNKSETIDSHEWYYDARKNKIVIRIYCSDEPPREPVTASTSCAETEP